ncbi:hypothetical protein C8R47DRAFT_1080778 [Mycena vitilis]|nr:hypothetical protein C8R47DRAFT_1080778 [Mycena vitilis]
MTPPTPHPFLTINHILNEPDHRVSLQSSHVILAPRLPSIPEPLVTRSRSKQAEPSPPPSPLTPLTPSAERPQSPSATHLPPSPPPPRRPTDYESDSSSSSSPTHRPPPAMSALAILDLPASKLPLLHEGETTQAQLRKLEVHCKNYFTLKNVEKGAQVANALGCFRDYRIADWLEIEAERTAALALTFQGFMDAVRTRLLPADWERHLR